tara:strand:+ start:182 stop:673 length:492 start_codon:yes stop_codon:yes gene_type:complete
MSNFYSKFIEITTLSVVIFSVYLLTMEIQKYTEATNVATYQKLVADLNNLQFNYLHDPFTMEAQKQVRLNGGESLEPELIRLRNNYPQAILRLTEVSFFSWQKGIFSDSQNKRFQETACGPFKVLLLRNVPRLFITDEYQDYLEIECEDFDVDKMIKEFRSGQ